MFSAFPSILPEMLYAVSLVFARVSCIIMLLPGVGDAHVPPRIRLCFALLFTLAITRVVAPSLPELPKEVSLFLIPIGFEMIVGLFLGACSRLFVYALETAGSIISQQTSLANAAVLNPMIGLQSSVVSTFLSVVATVFIFTTDTHHVMLSGIVKSYSIFTFDVIWKTGDMAYTFTDLIAHTFLIAIRIAAPALVIGTVFFVALGILNRLMPQMMIFFIAQPVQLVLGFLVLFLTTHLAVGLFLAHFQEFWQLSCLGAR